MLQRLVQSALAPWTAVLLLREAESGLVQSHGKKTPHGIPSISLPDCCTELLVHLAMRESLWPRALCCCPYASAAVRFKASLRVLLLACCNTPST
ncbi:hypothetical protein GUJ93_ZPchr0006g43228 [Zizania palustris]|uniref:Uncharacterized protein n=1 Tax=Zizania palustris TaxID=103762 RepID=A0A8J5VQQ6_ZIZPA|nr:hypothetical protein GUJ93_ZPchr0006g43228 [Zizania palustris]